MLGLIYRRIIKPILFLFKADDVHVFFLKVGNFLGKFSFTRFLVKKIFSYENEILSQEIEGINFNNPIGLSAGFDYDADLINILPSVGFGFHTIGTVTYLPYAGNPKPMLDRLPKSKSLLVNKGFKSRGMEAVLKKATKNEKRMPLGLSIGSTNKAYDSVEKMIEDVVSSFRLAIKEDYFDYYEMNISCPNLINTESLSEKLDSPLGFKKLLTSLSVLGIDRPLFIKMHLEKSIEDTLVLTDIASSYENVTGFIFANLVKDRTNNKFDKDEIKSAGRGNFSGKPTEDLTNALISKVFDIYKDRFLIIGCGGVFTGDDAYEKIKRGATLIQMITGMVYNGPQQIGVINKRLAHLLKKDGFKNISDAIGSYEKAD